MSGWENDSLSELYARLDDLCAKAERGETAISPFLTPRELYFSKIFLARRGALHQGFGGYADSERQRIYVLPDYMDAEGVELSALLQDFGLSCEITALKIEGSGYRTLTHRDFLGSLLGLGIHRDVLGDIVITGDKGREAVFFCDSVIAPFIESSLEKVASDKVKVKPIAIEEGFLPERKFAPIHDTVASPRFDCIVASLCSLSRAKAAEVISAGLAELDFECEERADRTVTPPAMISVRGYGKFRVHSVSDKTKRGRFRLVADKYI